MCTAMPVGLRDNRWRWGWYSFVLRGTRPVATLKAINVCCTLEDERDRTRMCRMLESVDARNELSRSKPTAAVGHVVGISSCGEKWPRAQQAMECTNTVRARSAAVRSTSEPTSKRVEFSPDDQKSAQLSFASYRHGAVYIAASDKGSTSSKSSPSNMSLARAYQKAVGFHMYIDLDANKPCEFVLLWKQNVVYLINL